VIERFLEELESCLASLGVRDASLQRVLAEARDHLEHAAREDGEEQAIESFGDPRRFARLVASELATRRTVHATFGAFAALALTGATFLLVFALVPRAGGWGDLFGGHVRALGPALALAIAVPPQIALVAGCLALLHAVRLWRRPAAGREALVLLRRRSNAALAFAAATLVAVVAYALDFTGALAAWWTWATVAACVVLAAPLAGAAYAVSSSVCPYAEPSGAAGDVFDDLGPVARIGVVRRLELPEHPWRLAWLSALVVGVAAFALGWYAEGDPGSGLVRGVFEAVVLLICFAALGRTLGLRRTDS
jgi:hypothetical protein